MIQCCMPNESAISDFCYYAELRGEACRCMTGCERSSSWRQQAMRQQQTLMLFDPANGSEKPYPSHADQWRSYHGNTAWLFNPWNGKRRRAEDIGSDTFGLLIVPNGEPVFAAAA